MKVGLSPSSTSDNRRLDRSASNAKGKVVAARVLDIVLDEKHKDYVNVGRWNGIGAIFYEIVNKSGTKSYPNFALPYDAQLKTYPLVNEIVVLISLPNQSIGSVSSNESYFYMSPLSIWNHPHHDAYPNILDGENDEEQQRDYQATSQGSVRRIGEEDKNDKSTEINLNSSNSENSSQNTFVEKSNIHPLMPFMGDSLLEGRHGQSLRFGSTAKSKSEKKNNWSDSGTNGDPITILRNGQPSKVSDEGWVPITENIKDDLSSIYLTSYQKIPIEDTYWEKINSYTSGDGLFENKPKSPSQYSNPQILFNSDRITINSKNDSILLRSQNSISLSSIISLNVDTPKTVIQSNNIFLGDAAAKERGIKGDTLKKKLDIILNSLILLTRVLEANQLWPGGLPSPDGGMLITSSNTKTQLQKELDSLNDILSTVVKTL
jgi:hypothetical protein